MQLRELGALFLWPMELLFAAVEIMCDLIRAHFERRDWNANRFPRIAEKVQATLDKEKAIDCLVAQGWDMQAATMAVHGESRKALAVAGLIAQGWDKVAARRIVGQMLKGKK